VMSVLRAGAGTQPLRLIARPGERSRA